MNEFSCSWLNIIGIYNFKFRKEVVLSKENSTSWVQWLFFVNSTQERIPLRSFDCYSLLKKCDISRLPLHAKICNGMNICISKLVQVYFCWTFRKKNWLSKNIKFKFLWRTISCNCEPKLNPLSAEINFGPWGYKA